MFRGDDSPADDRIRAARAAVGERDRLAKQRRRLVVDGKATELAALDRRLDELRDAGTELAAARDAKRAIIAASATPAAAELAEHAATLAAYDAEATALDATIATGDSARPVLAAFVTALEKAAPGGSVDKRKLSLAHALVDDVHAKLELFSRAGAAVEIVLDTSIRDVPAVQSWLETLGDVFFSAESQPIRDAATAAHATLDHLDLALIGARRRRAAIDNRRRVIDQMIIDLVDPR